MNEALDFDAAWQRVMREATRERDLPDILRLSDFNRAWGTRKWNMISTISDQVRVAPRAPRIVDIAKDGLMTRPVALLHPDDRLLYEALVWPFTPAVERQLYPEIRNARLKKHFSAGNPFENQRKAWVHFDRDSLKAYKEYGHEFLLSTDIVSFYEHIDLGILLKEFRRLAKSLGLERTGEMLSHFLNQIERHSDVWGLPQQNPPSAVLANLYLLPVDHILRQHPVSYLRYGDDIRVFSADERVLRNCLKDLNQVMRSRRLNLSAHKTRILVGDEIEEELEDSRKRAIEYGLGVNDPGVKDDIRSLFNDAVDPREIDARDVKFAVNRLRRLRDDYAVDWILHNLFRVPYLASMIVSYLGQHFAERDDIEEAVCAFLTDESRNIYPILELHLLRLLGRAGGTVTNIRAIALSVLRDQTKDNLVREYAALAIGAHAQPGDAALLDSVFKAETDIWLKRAVMVAYKMAADDKGWLNQAGQRDPDLDLSAKYLASVAYVRIP